ncbi:hypothetical protein [Rubrivivax albus]|uniref:Uncharacterized protein n=1 Tax=Rubrivivax albus TaxID=2499835 RepID=A0A3S2UPX8_9BURK|nr:hypothetical protein [Rubrivivax albus]RVT51421.1 hypothetical protein ENE75_11375 [Rubrivivax albus]
MRVDHRLLVVLALCMAGTAARAHGEDRLPGGPGWRVEAAAALVASDADGRWPADDPRGVFVTGTRVPDREGDLRLEHGLLALGWRFGPALLEGLLPAGVDNDGLSLRLVAGWHDRDDAHVEAAGLVLPLALDDSHLTLVLGREAVPMGAVIDRAGHLDLYGQPTLAQHATVDDAWIDDGLRLRWDSDARRGLRTLQFGFWRARAFPGGPAGPAAPSVQAQAGWDDWALDLFAARLEPEARGAAARSLGATGHVHGSLDCRRSLQQRVCFDGRSSLAAASLAWQPAGRPWQAAAAWMWRREAGALYSREAEVAWDGRTQGGWLDLRWTPRPGWTLGWRGERLVPRHTLTGAGVATIADDAGLADAAPTTRHTLALGWTLRPGWQLTLETGRQRTAAAGASAAMTTDHVALRLVVDGMAWEGDRP